MKILIIVMGILSLLSSCTGRKVKLAEEEDLALDGFEVERSKFRPDSFPLGGQTLYLILREYNVNNDGTKSVDAETIALLPRERAMIVDAYMNGQGERQRRIYTEDKREGKTRIEKQSPVLPIFGYWSFTDKKDGTEGTKILPYMSNVSGFGDTDKKEKYALFGDEFCEKVILTKENQRKVDSIIAKYDLGRRYDKKYTVDKSSQRMFAMIAEYEVFDTVTFNRKAMEEARHPDSEYKGRRYCDTLPDKTVIQYEYYYDWKDKQDAFYQREVIRPDYITEGKIYSETGMIKEQYWAINDNSLLRIGNTYHYDSTGKLIKTVCEDKGFEISFLQFQEILWKNAYYMPNCVQNGLVHKGRYIDLGKGFDENTEIPFYEYNYTNNYKYMVVRVNGITGQIISKEIGMMEE